ncbi:MAG: VOC family protein, partial [Candidatus Micrarchaeota archaeon]|nr:VOC family protein [Candidatus Micrarchaeota archaeon]
MNPVVHFEIPAGDTKRVSKFYSDAFGWKLHDTGEAMGHYILAQTGPTDKDGMIQKVGMINGGIFIRTEKTGSSTLLTMSVDNLEESMKKVVASGGKLVGEPVDIP